MCFGFLLYGLFGKSAKFKLASFADDLVTIDHTFDQELYNIFNLIKFDVDSLGCNPSPESEIDNYFCQAVIDRINMLNKNVLLRSRMFIDQAKRQNISKNLEHTLTTIQVLMIGDDAGIIPGVLAYFSQNRMVELFYVDSDERKLAKLKLMYQDFNIGFINRDPKKYLSDGYSRTYDFIVTDKIELKSEIKSVMRAHSAILDYDNHTFDKTIFQSKKFK